MLPAEGHCRAESNSVCMYEHHPQSKSLAAASSEAAGGVQTSIEQAAPRWHREVEHRVLVDWGCCPLQAARMADRQDRPSEVEEAEPAADKPAADGAQPAPAVRPAQPEAAAASQQAQAVPAEGQASGEASAAASGAAATAGSAAGAQLAPGQASQQEKQLPGLDSEGGGLVLREKPSEWRGQQCLDILAVHGHFVGLLSTLHHTCSPKGCGELAMQPCTLATPLSDLTPCQHCP